MAAGSCAMTRSFCLTARAHQSEFTTHGLLQWCTDFESRASEYAKLQEHACNRELSEHEQRREARLEAVLRSMAAILNVSLELNGDPRGFVVTLHFPTQPMGIA